MRGQPWRTAAVIATSLGTLITFTHWGLYQVLRSSIGKPFRIKVSIRARFGQDSAILDKYDQAQARARCFLILVHAMYTVAAFALPISAGLYVIAGLNTWLVLSGVAESWWLLSNEEIRRTK